LEAFTMRYQTLAVIAASIFTLSACGGGDEKENASSSESTTSSTTPPDTGSGAAATSASTATAMPITGTTHEVKMVQDAKGYRFDPENITVKVGDGIKFIAVSGNPHNVGFEVAGVPAESKAQLAANMPNPSAELTSPMLAQPNEAYTISFAGVKPGKYALLCPVHLAQGMKGTVTVE
jgi:plastocyanin